MGPAVLLVVGAHGSGGVLTASGGGPNPVTPGEAPVRPVVTARGVGVAVASALIVCITASEVPRKMRAHYAFGLSPRHARNYGLRCVAYLVF